MRMSIRRFTRLTNAFSKKLENHAAMVALYFMYYNFGRAHQALRVTPAMRLDGDAPQRTASLRTATLTADQARALAKHLLMAADAIDIQRADRRDDRMGTFDELFDYARRT